MTMHPAIKLRHLRLFLDVIAAGSLTGAARLRGLSQPALSTSLRELEGLLGGPLFLRQGRRIVLTAQGDRFRRLALEALQALDAGAALFGAAASSGRIAVGVLPTVSSRFFPAIAGRFLTAHPGVMLGVESGPHPYLLQRLRDGHLDLMIGRMPSAAETGGLHFAALYEDPIVLVVRKGHPLAQAQAALVVAGVPLILPTREAIIRRVVEDYLASIGRAGLHPAVETTTYGVGRALVLDADAAWFISRGVVEQDLEDGLMVPVSLGASYLAGSVGITSPRAKPSGPATVHLIDMIRAAAARSGAADGRAML